MYVKLIPLIACSLSTWLCLSAPLRAADHPLAPLSAAELQTSYESVFARFKSDPALPDSPLRFTFVALAEPPKSFVLSWTPGRAIPRKAEVHVLHYPTNSSWVAEVDLKHKKVVKLSALPAGVQPAASSEEYIAATDLVRAYEPWRKAVAARGVDPDLAYIDVWAAGDLALPDDVVAGMPFGKNTRFMRCLTFDRGAPPEELDPLLPQNPYDRPVEGIVVSVDMNQRKVVDMTDTIKRPVIQASGNATQSRRLKPLIVQQPQGSDVQLEGQLVRWHAWQFYAVLHPREGLVLYDVRYEGRPIAYRLALSEIYVPYGLGDINWVWRSAFDVGEYNAGILAQTLEANRDVPENTQFIDAVFFSDLGPDPENPTGSVEFPATIGLYERDSGILWTRTDPTTYDRDTRFARELVTTWNCWIGNYIYAFDWIFKLDGSLEVKVNLTGTTLNRGTTAEAEVSAPKVGKDEAGVIVGAANHQHFLNFRLDLDVDGPQNHAMQMEVARLPNTGFKNAFDALVTPIESEGHFDADPFRARHWHVENMSVMNQFGKPTGYALEPTSFAVPYSAPDFPGLERAQFAQHQLWVTRYSDGEHYAAGNFPNQAQKPDGVGVYTQPAEALHDQDIVLWYTTGFTHIAKPEDYPVMSTETIGFRIAPRGFFKQNPGLSVADQGG